MKSFLADVNVWLALVYDQHVHHDAARRWFESLETENVLFCRMTQLAFLRLLTNQRVMGQDRVNQRTAWQMFDRIMGDSRVSLLMEPEHLESEWRRLSRSPHAATNMWPDAYLAAFASAAGLAVVTMDKGFSRLSGVEVFYLPG